MFSLRINNFAKPYQKRCTVHLFSASMSNYRLFKMKSDGQDCNLEHQSQGLGATSGSQNDLRSCTNGWHEANYSMLINKDWTLLWTVRIT